MLTIKQEASLAGDMGQNPEGLIYQFWSIFGGFLFMVCKEATVNGESVWVFL